MINHMKIRTTLILPDQLMRELKRRAAARGETLSAVVEETLRRGLAPDERDVGVAPLPKHRMGRPRVDVADRDALERAMEER
jgi:plasmid stability protein